MSDFIHLPIEEHGVVLAREDGTPSTNVPHLVKHHSPDGFEFGYMGSGPAELALNILEWMLRREGYAGPTVQCWRGACFQLAWNLHQNLKKDLIAPCPRAGGVITFETLTDWLTVYRALAEPFT